MSNFNYKEIYVEDGKRVLEMDILPEKYCNFDCIFCSIGRSHNKVDKPQSFEEIQESLKELESIIENNKVDLVYICSQGEPLVNNNIKSIIKLIKSKGITVRLISNGYLFGKNEYIETVNMFDEVIGEIKSISEEEFQKNQRPIHGYTLEEYISNMIVFNKQYKGKFILSVTIIKGCNDDDDSVNKIKNAIDKIAPDKVTVQTINDERFKKKLAVTDEKLKEISKRLV